MKEETKVYRIVVNPTLSVGSKNQGIYVLTCAPEGMIFYFLGF